MRRLNLQWRIAALRNGLRDATAYRMEFFIEIAGSAFIPAITQIILWYALFQLNGAETVAGMTYAQMMQYTFTSILFTQIRGGGLDFELQEMIRSGSLSNYLLRPVSLVEFVYLRGLGPKLLITAVGLLLAFTVGWYYGLQPQAVLLAMLLALLGNVIDYQISASLATVAFYWEEAHSVIMVKNMLVALLSGELLPLNLFPPAATWIWQSTPFYIYVFGPTQVALGHWTYTETMTHFGIALLWLVFGTILVRTTWALAIKRYQSLGG